MVPLDKTAALQRLVKTGSSDRELVAADIEAMIGIVEKHRCFDLEYSDLNEAIEFLGNFLAAPGGAADT